MGLRLNGSLPRRLASWACAAAVSRPRTVQTRFVASTFGAPGAALPLTVSRVFARGKKTTTLDAKDLPQGLISGAPLEDPDEDAGPAYPTVLQQVRNNMRKFDHCVLLTRVGNFYEVCFQLLPKPGNC